MEQLHHLAVGDTDGAALAGEEPEETQQSQQEDQIEYIISVVAFLSQREITSFSGWNDVHKIN